MLKPMSFTAGTGLCNQLLHPSHTDLLEAVRYTEIDAYLSFVTVKLGDFYTKMASISLAVP